MHINLQVRKPKELLISLIDRLSAESFISFEGDFSKIQQNEYTHHSEEYGVFKRNTRTPKQQFLVFKLDNGTKSYLKTDFLNKVGLRSNVLHVLLGTEDKIVFASYDHFDQDCVLLLKSEVFDDNFLYQLAQENIIEM